MQPTEITVHQATKVLEIGFETAPNAVQTFHLSFEFLRVFSPSAEVQGHTPSQAVLQTGKQHVNVVAAEPVGHYALKLTFDDGHDSGLYTWVYLHTCGTNYQFMWQGYLDQLQAAGGSRS